MADGEIGYSKNDLGVLAFCISFGVDSLFCFRDERKAIVVIYFLVDMSLTFRTEISKING